MYKAQGEANPPAGGEEGPASAKASAGEEREAKEGEVKEGKIEE